jgi:hypothetical protein
MKGPAAMRIISTVIVMLLLPVVPTRAASEDAYVTSVTGGFHALSRIPEESGVALFPLTDDELADITKARLKVPPTSPAPSHQLPDTSGVSRPIDDPSARGRRSEENSSVKAESGGEAPPKTRGRLSVEEEPDPRAVIDWLLKDNGRFPRFLDQR